MDAPGYIDNLLEICKDDHIDLIIPTIDTDLLVLSENKGRFEANGTKVLISAVDKIRICRDKNLTSQFFVDCGLLAPLPINDWKLYDSGFPAFIKPKDGSSSINAFRVESAEELEVYADQIGDYVVQPFVDGREFTIDIFCDWNGNPVSIVPRERLQVRAGEVLKTRIDMDLKMIEESRAICEAFQPCGPITVQLIRDDDGVDWFIEINPRFGGGAPLSMKAGARSAETILKMLEGWDEDSSSIAPLGMTNKERTGYISDGAFYSRFDQSVCITEGEGVIKGMIFDLDDTLYSEKEYVKSGYRAVSDYLVGQYEERLWSLFEEGKPAIDCLLQEIGREAEKTRVLDIYRSHKPEISLYDGVLDVINRLMDCGIKVGIITDGRPEGQKKKIDALRLNIDDVIITDELGGIQFRKPCDIAFRIFQNRWRLPAEEIIYVGDNPSKDFQAPKQLGMRSIWYKNPDSLYYEDAGLGIRTIRNIGEIIDIVSPENVRKIARGGYRQS